ncbi:hypothetical protein BLSS_3002 [Bifidobacterium longum subsp. suis]|uniref:Uncharacterized protein n=1 Tax=Bifidobacterium longum subsp. suis TaxID=1695 RepID=A0A087BP93_BIFLN|nr:hypothetical protein BLSS_3002 [Bifidobacterium longum subsp. suis]
MIRFRFGGFLLFGFGCLGLEGAGADDDADGQGDGADGRRGRIGPRPAPYGAEGLHGRSRYGTVGRCCRWRRCRRRCRRRPDRGDMDERRSGSYGAQGSRRS